MKLNMFHALVLGSCITLPGSARQAHASGGHEPLEQTTTIGQGETLLVGAVDLTLVPADGVDKRLYLLKHEIRYWPFENEQVTLEQVPGFQNKWFFFVKVDRWDAKMASQTHTLRFETPDNRMMYILTFPLLARNCRGETKKTRHCTGGITNAGLYTLSAQRTATEDGGGWEYSFTKDPDDPDVRAAFERRYEVEYFTPEGDELGSHYLRVTRR